jgi:hypothetical protein
MEIKRGDIVWENLGNANIKIALVPYSAGVSSICLKKLGLLVGAYGPFLGLKLLPRQTTVIKWFELVPFQVTHCYVWFYIACHYVPSKDS